MSGSLKLFREYFRHTSHDITLFSMSRLMPGHKVLA
jgi:hypothetical protein